jgi:2-dehydropantoate 2-reductase
MDRKTEVNTPEESALVQDFGSILEAGGTALTIVPEIQRMKFVKNIWNVVFASFATLNK